MKTPVERRTVDLSGYPDLVVIYLGMRVNVLEGLKTALSYGRPIFRAVAARPDGQLYHQMFLFSLFPLHLGIRQYWRDFEALERWARSAPHRQWWHRFLRGTGGTGFWHETYFLRGGMEAIYGDVPAPTGFLAFAPAKPARGALFSARKRLNLRGEAPLAPAVSEGALYGEGAAGGGASADRPSHQPAQEGGSPGSPT